MNNLYHRFAVASVGIALGFTLGANKEAKAAIFTFTSTHSYYVVDYYNQDGVIDNGDSYPRGRYVGRNYQEGSPPWQRGEYKSSYEFNIAGLLILIHVLRVLFFRLGLRVFNTLILISIPTRMPMASQSILH